MKLIAQIFIAVLLALLVKDRIDLLILEYELKIETERLAENQRERKKIQLEKEIQKRSANAPESDINWSGNQRNARDRREILEQLIQEKN